MVMRGFLIVIMSTCLGLVGLFGQDDDGAPDLIEMGESMDGYIKMNHLEEIENIFNKFMTSKPFLEYLLLTGHHIPHDSVKIKRRDLHIGNDIDVFVKHFTEHQNYTMLLVPVDIAPLMIQDTLLFSVVEVSNDFLAEKYYHYNLKNDSVKSALLSALNHDLITNHLFEHLMEMRKLQTAEVRVELQESYLSTNTISLNRHEMGEKEKYEIMKHWGLLKKMLTHNVDMNVEMNIYIFGADAMRIVHYMESDTINYGITPRNVFARHHFAER